MFLAAGARRLDRLDLGDAVAKQHVTTVRVRQLDSCTNCTNGAATQRVTPSQPRRPSGPRLLLAMARGRHKIFLGMAAGVGKTYRMLQEGQAEAEAGRDVVIGLSRDPRQARHDGAGGRAGADSSARDSPTAATGSRR